MPIKCEKCGEVVDALPIHKCVKSANKWSTDKPVEPGWYWVKEWHGEIYIVHVDISESLFETVTEIEDPEIYRYCDYNSTDEWYGPIQPPE